MTLIDKTTKSIFKYIGIFTAILTIAYSIYFLLDLIIIFAISVLVGMILNPVIIFFEKQGLSRIASVILVFILGSFFIFLTLSYLIPMVINQMNTLAKSLNQESVSKIFIKIESDLKAYIPFLDTKNLAAKAGELISNLFFNSINNLSNILSSIFSILSVVIIIPFITFFLLKDNNNIMKGIINLMPNKYFEMSYSVLKSINKQLGRYVRAWILDALVVATLSALGLTLLGIKNALIIGLIAGVGHLIPFFGPLIGGIPAITISVVQFGDFSMLPYIIILFIVIYTFDNGFIQPNFFSKSTDMHPLLIILLILAGSQIMGAVGMLLAVPVSTVLRTATREIYFGVKNYKIIHQ